MKILLISANSVTIPYPVYPLSLDYVANSIKDKHQVEIIDINVSGTDDDFMQIINEFQPQLIGLSLRNIDNTDIMEQADYLDNYDNIINTIRKTFNVPIVLGGSGFTIFPNEIMNKLEADFGIIGEGERLPLLIDAIEKGLDVSTIPGVVTRENPGDTPEPWDNDFKRDFAGTRNYIDFYLKYGGMLNLQSKRGCSFKCIYCTYPHIEGRKLRLLPPSEVAETAMELQEAGAKYLFITDSAFNCHQEHSLEVANEFIKAGLSIPWGAFFAPLNIRDDYFKIMKQAGLSHVEFGTESFSNLMLKNYQKPFNAEDVYKSHRDAVEANLHVAHYMLLGGPGENIDTLEETVINLKKLSKTVVFFFCGMRIYPKTPLYDIALSEGQINGSDDLLKPVFYRSELISQEDIIKFIETNKKDRPNWVIGSGGYKTAKFLRRMYKRGHSGPLWENLIQ